MSNDLETLKRLLATNSVRTGSFVLSSGKSSSVYVDARLTTMSPQGLTLIGALGLRQIRAEGWKADSVGGLTLGADPIAFAISYTSAKDTKPLRAFTVRKAPKTHGTGNLIEGPFRAGDKVIIVEDVITTGSSAIQAIESVTQADGTVLGVLAVVDREEGGREAIEARGYSVTSLTTISDLLAVHDSADA